MPRCTARCRTSRTGIRKRRPEAGAACAAAEAAPGAAFLSARGVGVEVAAPCGDVAVRAAAACSRLQPRRGRRAGRRHRAGDCGFPARLPCRPDEWDECKVGVTQRCRSWRLPGCLWSSGSSGRRSPGFVHVARRRARSATDAATSPLTPTADAGGPRGGKGAAPRCTPRPRAPVLFIHTAGGGAPTPVASWPPGSNLRSPPWLFEAVTRRAGA